MVSCKNINDIQVVPKSLHVFRCANIRLDIDFGGTDALKVFRGEEQVVGGDLTGDRKTLEPWMLLKGIICH